MSEGEAWVDYDYTPPPRVYDQCDRCGSTYTLQHHCDLVAEVAKLKEELEILHPAVLYRAISEALPKHRWSHTSFAGQFCSCGYNGDHENHLTLCIVRAIEAMRVQS